MDNELSAHEVAQKLKGFCTEKFGGKDKGRYRIIREDLRAMFGGIRLDGDVIDNLSHYAWDAGLVIIDLDSDFVVMTRETFGNYRKLPKRLVDNRPVVDNRPGIDWLPGFTK